MRHRSASVSHRIRIARGFTYVELLVSITISALLIAGLMGVVNTATKTSEVVGKRNDLSQQARFAMQRMTQNIAHSRQLLLPFNDNPYTNYPEHIREQTVPPSPPIGDSTLATAVLAFTLPAHFDTDANGVPDADNDGDGQIDEDLPEDIHNDFGSGVYGVDDDGDGGADNSIDIDDDERLNLEGEDPINGIDDDGDNNIDEDPSANMNEDGCPGICGVDDDGDGNIDEGSVDDDDEDGTADEDWYDPLVYFLDAGILIERLPVPWDENSSGGIDGRDFVESSIAENVTRFRVERVATPGPFDRVDLTLELTDPANGESVSLNTTVRLGGAL